MSHRYVYVSYWFHDFQQYCHVGVHISFFAAGMSTRATIPGRPPVGVQDDARAHAQSPTGGITADPLDIPQNASTPRRAYISRRRMAFSHVNAIVSPILSYML